MYTYPNLTPVSLLIEYYTNIKNTVIDKTRVYYIWINNTVHKTSCLLFTITC